MPISLNGSTNVITGVAVGGLPDGIVDTDMLAANAVSEAKLATSPQQGLAKAWVNFNGQTVTSATDMTGVRDSFNISSVVDNGTGDYTINFTSAFANANYVVCGSSGGQSSTSNGAVYQYDQGTAKTTSACRVITITTSGGLTDPPQIAVAFFGD